MADLRIKVKIGEWPNEVPDPIRFGEDRTHAAYDPEYARRFWRILLQVDRAFKLFRTGFIGKCSPVHFFWGSFDLAVTRFSGRLAPLHPGGIPNLSDEVVREASGGFVAVAGEWFGMWQSASHAAGPSAFQILITMMGVLIFVTLKDEEFC